MVFLGHQGHALFLHPRPDILPPEPAQSALHQGGAAGIDTGQVLHAFKGIGQVTAPAAGDGHLGQGLFVGLEQGNPAGRIQPGQAGGTKAAGRAGTDDGDRFHAAFRSAGRGRQRMMATDNRTCAVI